MQKVKSSVKKAVLCAGMLLLTLILCIGFSGCAVNVSGKTFVYEKYEVKYDDSVSAEIIRSDFGGGEKGLGAKQIYVRRGR